MTLTRREFVGLTVTGSAIFGLGSTAPRFLAQAAEQAGEQDRQRRAQHRHPVPTR
jgi:hypothetical protein